MEEQLAVKIKNGESSSFRMLYNEYSEYALRNAYMIVKDRDSAGDVVQETFIRVYKNINSYDESKPFKPWFYRILINECYRYVQKNAKIELVENIEDAVPFEADDEDDEYDAEKVRNAINKLDELHRVPITLKYLNGFSEKEIAEILEINVNTLKSRLFKGRKALKQLLGGEADGVK